MSPLDTSARRTAAPAAVPPTPTRRTKRSKPGYGLAAAVAVVAVLGGVTWAVFAFVDLRHDIDGFARTAVPGRVTLRLPGSTGRVVYYEGPGRPTLEMLDLRVTAPDGSRVAVREYGGDVRYDGPSGVVGQAVGTFDTSTQGTYTISAAMSVRSDDAIAIGSSIVSGSGGRVAAGAVIAVIGTAAAAVLAVVTAVRRSQS